MFELELENLQRIVRAKTIGNAQSISLKSILESNIPTSVKSFFKGEVEWMLYQERRTGPKESRFNYAQEDVRLLQEQTDMLLVYHYNYGQSEFQEAGEKAAHFLFNYLCRPVWTLEQFLFEERAVMSARDLEYRFRYCADYRYYWTIIEKYLASKGKESLSKDEAVELLRKIDREIVRDSSAADLARMTEPFFSFVHYIHRNSANNEAGGIPAKALSYFFEDKGVRSVAEHLLKLRDQGRTSLQFDELTATLTSSFVKKGWYVEEESQPAAEAGSKRSPTLLLPERERVAIVSALFGGQESAYAGLISTVTDAAGWDEAGAELDHFFSSRSIDPFTREAIMLTNALQSHFTNRDDRP